MASIQMGRGSDQAIRLFEKLESMPDTVVGGALEAAGDIVHRRVIATGEAMGVFRTGQVVASFRRGKAERDGGTMSVEIKPTGSRTDGNKRTNSEVAFINEYGKRGQPPRPFMRTAADKSEDEIERVIAQRIDEYIG